MNESKTKSVPLHISSTVTGESHTVVAVAPGIVVTVTLQMNQWGPNNTADLLESVAAAIRANGNEPVNDPHTSWAKRGVRQ